MLKTKKNQRNVFLFVKVILFLGVMYLLYSQVARFDSKAWGSFSLENPLSLIITILLVVPNIWIAHVKWLLTLKAIEIKATPKIKVHSFFAGLVTGLLTPNMIGNFLGRVYYFDKEKRGVITAFTLLTNFSEFLASITFGAVSVFVLGELLVLKDVHELMYFLLFAVVISYLIYYFIDNFLGRIQRFKFSAEFRSFLKKRPWFRTEMLFLSFARFGIFTLQFSLMLHAFGVDWNWNLIAAIWQVYLITILVPSLFLGNLGIRESIALLILTPLGLNEVSILAASFFIWTLNTLSPALLGLLICRKHETQ